MVVSVRYMTIVPYRFVVTGGAGRPPCESRARVGELTVGRCGQ